MNLYQLWYCSYKLQPTYLLFYEVIKPENSSNQPTKHPNDERRSSYLWILFRKRLANFYFVNRFIGLLTNLLHADETKTITASNSSPNWIELNMKGQRGNNWKQPENHGQWPPGSNQNFSKMSSFSDRSCGSSFQQQCLFWWPLQNQLLRTHFHCRN